MNSVADVNRIYQAHGRMQVEEHIINHQPASRFNSALVRLDKRLSASDMEQWSELAALLRRARFRLAAAPLAPADPGVLDDVGHERIQGLLNLLAERVGFSDLCDSVRSALVELRTCHDNPILELLSEVTRTLTERPTPVMLLRSDLVRISTARIGQLGLGSQLRFIAPESSRDSLAVSSLVLIGAVRWFPDHLLSAPRSDVIHVLRHNWISDRVVRRADFSLDTRGPVPAPLRVMQSVGTADSTAPNADWVDAADVRPALPNVTARFDSKGDEDEVVEALCLQVEGGGVFLEWGDAHRVTVLDLESAVSIVRSVPTREVEVGMFLLLRTEGSGDYLIDVANRLLQGRAQELRRCQTEWKARLRELVAVHGVDEALARLRSHDCSRANAQNLANWMSGRTIRPQSPVDFQAIMSAVGWSEKAKEYWRAMTLIHGAHIRAGQAIRHELEARVSSTDLADLVRFGRYDFALETGGGKLTALRVTAILPDRPRVPSSELGSLNVQFD